MGFLLVPSGPTPLLSCPQAARAPQPAGGPPAMAIVQTLPVSIEAAPEGAAQLRAAARSPPSSRGAMGSVGSLIAGRPCHDRSCQPPGGGGSFRVHDGLLRASPPDPLLHALPPKKPCSAAPGVAHAYANEGFHGEWLEAASPVSPCSDSDEARDDRAPSGSIRGPPPKLVPVSGKLEEVQWERCWGLCSAPSAVLGLGGLGERCLGVWVGAAWSRCPCPWGQRWSLRS